MSDFERSILRINDQRNGRVIPNWRYGLMYLLTLVLIAVARMIPDGFWFTFGVLFVWVITYAALIGPYRMRTIS